MQSHTRGRVYLVLASYLLLSAAPSAPVAQITGGLAAKHDSHSHAHSAWSARNNKTNTPRVSRTRKPSQTNTPVETQGPAVNQAVEQPVQAAPLGSTPAERVFDLSNLDEPGIAWAQRVLNQECSFDWTRVAAGVGADKVRVELDAPPARGMYYPAEKRLVVHRYFYSDQPAVASRVLAWEAAHVVDIYSLSDTERQSIADLYHEGSDDHGWLSGAYEDQVGEAFMEGFVAAFCPGLEASPYFTHETTPEVAAGIRDLLG